MKKNIAASVRQRILNVSRTEGRSFNELLQYYAMERFLYRLTKSEYSSRFILKGALMLRAWKSPKFRPTMDIDLLGKINNNEDEIMAVFREILNTDVEPDGLNFEESSLRTELITEEAEYRGTRVLFKGDLSGARVNIQVDIGFGDVIYPKPVVSELPVLFGESVSQIFGYSRESSIAEKLDAMISHGRLNSRMKDFYDIWLLSRQFDFNGDDLFEAIKRTLKNRDTNIQSLSEIFTDEYIDEKKIQWRAFQRRMQNVDMPNDFKLIANLVYDFLEPIIEALKVGKDIPQKWKKGGSWL